MAQITEARSKRILTASSAQLGADGALGQVADADDDRSVSFQIVWTGDPTGTFKVQVSNAPAEYLDDTEVWEDVADATVAAAGSANHGGVDVMTGFRYVRIYYTRTSGDGSCQIDMCMKAVG